MQQPYKITILYGAIREGRLSIRAARAVEKALNASGMAVVTLIDIRQYNIPVMTARLKDDAHPAAGILEISKALESADGIVFVSPEYNNSYSGALKNVVDYFTWEWSKKPIGVVTASNGRQGGINASTLIQLLILALNAYPMPYKLLVPEIQNALDEDGNPLHEIMQKNLEHFVTEFLWFTDAISTKNKQAI